MVAGALLPAAANAGVLPGLSSDAVEPSRQSVVFVPRAGEVEVHLMLRYDGEPDEFVWVIPVPAPATFEVGSQRLFENLRAGTLPVHRLKSTARCPAAGAGGGPEGPPPPEEAPGEEPELASRPSAAASEVHVFGPNGAELMNWLLGAGFASDSSALPRLNAYAQRGWHFVIVRPNSTRDFDQVHPLILRYPGDQMVVPLQLFQLAGTDELELEVFVLGGARAASTNYRHVEVNRVRVDWLGRGHDYLDRVAGAVQARTADGRAFAAEFAGAPSAISDAGLFDWAWDTGRFTNLAWWQVAPELENQGLLACRKRGCDYRHPGVEQLLLEFLPPPIGLSGQEFYACPRCFDAYFDPEQWRPDGFALQMWERIVLPGGNAYNLLHEDLYLTRLFTVLDPSVSAEDPVFHFNADQPEVTTVHEGEIEVLCNGDSLARLPDDREVLVPGGGPWPSFEDSMPVFEVIAMIGLDGPADVLVSSTEEIDAALEEHNLAHGWPPQGCACRARPGEGRGGLPPSGWALAALLMLWRQRRTGPETV